jgi:hypothetical protein
MTRRNTRIVAEYLREARWKWRPAHSCANGGEVSRKMTKTQPSDDGGRDSGAGQGRALAHRRTRELGRLALRRCRHIPARWARDGDDRGGVSGRFGALQVCGQGAGAARIRRSRGQDGVVTGGFRRLHQAADDASVEILFDTKSEGDTPLSRLLARSEPSPPPIASCWAMFQSSDCCATPPG